MTVKEKIEELRAELHRHNYNYYVLNTPEISDKEFDDMMRELQDLEQRFPDLLSPDSPTLRVGGQPLSQFVSVVHTVPMLSIQTETETGPEGAWNFDARVRKELELPDQAPPEEAADDAIVTKAEELFGPLAQVKD